MGGEVSDDLYYFVKAVYTPDGCKPKALAERLHHADVRILAHETDRARLIAGEVDVCLVDDDDALVRLELEELSDGGEGEGGAGGVAGRAEEDELDGRVGGDGLFDLYSTVC